MGLASLACTLVAMATVWATPTAAGRLVVLRSSRPHAAEEVAQARVISTRRLAGAKVMVPMSGVYPDRWLLARARAGEIGGVIIFSDNVSAQLGKALAALQQAALTGNGHRLVIAVDQEGGTVKRLADAPPDESAQEMTPADAEREGRATAAALAALGINTDLAPVADISYSGDFLGSRTFSSDPARVATDACDFARGLASGHVNATFKHFPGLGAAWTTTDEATVTVRLSGSQLLSDLAPYRACQPPLVMVSTAIYTALDPGTPAVFSGAIVRGLLRAQLAFKGVTITDTLDGPSVSGPGAAVRASRAGIDMLLYTGNEYEAWGAVNELAQALGDGELGRQQLEASDRRIWALTG